MLFGRFRRHGGPAKGARRSPAGGRHVGGVADADSERVLIEFEMMRKGYVVDRGGKKVRQASVTVNGSTRLVTSGDRVEPATYEALVQAGIIDEPLAAQEPGVAPAIDE